MKILALLLVSAALFNSVLGLGYEQSRFLQALFQSMQEDFAEGQHMRDEIKAKLKPHIGNDFDKIKWALEGHEAGLEVQDIEYHTDQNSPLHKHRVIFLEEGNDFAGLQHILAEHEDDFKELEKIEGEEQISQSIEDTLKSKVRVELGRSESGGVKVLYQTKNGNFLRVITAANGSITTAYPLSSKEEEWDISLDKARISEDIDCTTLLPGTYVIRLMVGNRSAGLKFIYKEQAQGFNDIRGYSTKLEISQFIKMTMTTCEPFKVTSVDRRTLVTYRTGDDYLKVHIAPNGFINSTILQKGKLPLWRITSPALKTRNTHTITFVEGVGYRGRQYTYEQHKEEFYMVGAQDQEEISKFIKATIERYRPKHNMPTTRGGIDLLYEITENELYLRVFIGRSGFITTAFPVPSESREWIIGTDKAGVKQDQIKSVVHVFDKLPVPSLLIHKTITLETAGSHHIFFQHGKQFKNLLKKIDSKHAISKFMRETMERNNPNKVASNEQGGMDVFYPASTQDYLKVAIGRNGLIFEAYPLSSLDIEWEITILQAGITEGALKSKLGSEAPMLRSGFIFLREGNSDFGLKHIYVNLPWMFKHLTGIDSVEGTSKFIKNTMEKQGGHLVELIRGKYNNINALYLTDDFFLLVVIARNGFIVSIYLTARQSKDISWSISTTEARISANDVDKFTSKDASLRYTHIIEFEKGAEGKLLTQMYKQIPTKFKRQMQINSIEDMSKFMKNTMETHKHPFEVIQGKGKGINVLYTSEDIYLLVFIGGNGNIHGAQVIERQDEDHLTWSISTTEAGLSVKGIEAFIPKHARLCYSHIISFGKGTEGKRLTQMYGSIPLEIKHQMQINSIKDEQIHKEYHGNKCH